MNFVSLSNPADRVGFNEALIKGVPDDITSVYVPETIPRLSDEEINIIAEGDQRTIGQIMLKSYVEDDISSEDLEQIVDEATTFDTPLVAVGNRYVLELTHGPTMAFKDVAAGYLGSFLSHNYKETGEPVVVVVATSGDTGGAIAEGMAGREGVEVVVAYPKGKVSQLQQDQLRRVDENIHAVEVEGDFNDCLDLTLAALGDDDLNARFNMTSANSISVGRLLPQTTYYAGLLQHFNDGYDGRVVVPSGNLGNLTAAILAWRMGLPMPKFVAAHNLNDYMTRLINFGHPVKKEYVPTVSNAMDVANPKNAQRINWLFEGKLKQLQNNVGAWTVDDARTKKIIRRVYGEEGYLLDPHTAVAWGSSRPGDIVVSTAAPQKFASEIEELTGIPVDDYNQRAALLDKPERYVTIPNDKEAFLRVFDQLDA